MLPALGFKQIHAPGAAPRRLPGRLRSFARDERGATAMVFAFAAMPMMIAIGAGVDLARLTQKRSDLQQATDFTALALAKDITANGGTATSTVAAKYLLATNRDPVATIVSGYPTTNTQTGEICVQARTTVPTVVMSIIGIQTMPTSATACANVALGNYEVALVLDNTGSMANQASGGTKIAALQAAAPVREFHVQLSLAGAAHQDVAGALRHQRQVGHDLRHLSVHGQVRDVVLGLEEPRVSGERHHRGVAFRPVQPA